MSKVLGLVLVLVMVAGVAFAAPDPNWVGDNEILNRVYNPNNIRGAWGVVGDPSYSRIISGTITTSRQSIYISDADSGITFSIGSADAVNCSGYRYAKVIVSMDEAAGAAGITIVPWFGDGTIAKYMAGTARTLSGDSIYVIEVNGEDDFYPYILELTGAVEDKTTTIKIQGFNLN